MLKYIFNIIKNTYFTKQFYYISSGIVVLFVLGHFISIFYFIAKISLLFLSIILIINSFFLNYIKEPIEAKRILGQRLSNGDNNEITIKLKNLYPYLINFKIIDEIPFQFQIRNFEINISINYREEKNLNYILKPTKRGEYNFGKLIVYANHKINLISRKISFDYKKTVSVYPSFIQMRKYELLAISNRLTEAGIKKIRRLNYTHEFDQIKEYIEGEDFRTINWKATARKNQLMVNQYQDEKSQQVFSVIDMGRTMEMPFENMSLLDYAINSSLIISNIAIYKQDKAGLITFSNNIHNILPAEKSKLQMNKILETLYRQNTNFKESSFEELYISIKNKVKQRSLLLLYTNFEWEVSMQRQLKYLKQLNKNHLLIVIFFKNTEIKKIIEKKSTSISEIYTKTIAEKLSFEKKLIVKELQKHGIQSILTEPENLNVNTINKYLQLKASGQI
ncbi:MAG: DUF58 domain-containing protein [Bacteroidales bacterium]|nr:DUF58 domain-containing protein [Bacteroidales bacterium]MBN2756411.1 DUF58 domain-containing protein [Bacteroidales bacterium]